MNNFFLEIEKVLIEAGCILLLLAFAITSTINHLKSIINFATDSLTTDFSFAINLKVRIRFEASKILIKRKSQVRTIVRRNNEIRRDGINEEN